ncbi:MAG TPA: OB-fold nucleic acid binding domain-containing protein, partial [Dehalococcoidia bacterium]|nr:OB-fold nucleic acid binding domain-containing protein [Dehalococcoidia bacterium]
QSTMFDLFGEEVATPLSNIDLESAPIPKGEILAWEKELLGVWLSEHPFTHAAPVLAPYVTALCNEISPDTLGELPAQGRDFVMAGIVGSTRRLTTRDGRGFIAADVQDLSGNYEVTVWPDVYDRTMDFWLPGAIVLMQVRVRERGDRLSAGVQDVVRFDESFIPPVWAVVTSESMRRTNGNGASNGHTNGNGTKGHTKPASTAAAPAPTPEPEDDAFRFTDEDLLLPGELPPDDDAFLPPASEALLSQATNADPGEPEDASVEARRPDDPPVQTLAAPRPEPTEALRLSLKETEDESDDQHRLSTVFRLLQEQPGADKVLLTIHTREGETINLALPTARLDEALCAKLREALEGAKAGAAT